MNRTWTDWPETLDVRYCERHHWCHESGTRCPLCAADVPDEDTGPHPIFRPRVWLAGLAVWAIFASVGALMWITAWWLLMPSAEQAEALARLLP